MTSTVFFKNKPSVIATSTVGGIILEDDKPQGVSEKL